VMTCCRSDGILSRRLSWGSLLANVDPPDLWVLPDAMKERGLRSS
jgi:hypothetical protein